eukprot:137942_1
MSIPSLEKEPLSLVIISLVLNFCVAYPYSFYALLKFYRSWNKIYFIKRRRFITLLMVIIISLNALLVNPTIVYFGITDWNNAMYHSCLYAHLILYTVRVWCLYYDHKIHSLADNKQWHSVINNTHFSNNWFMKHRSTYGNEKWIIWYIIHPIFIIIESIYIITKLHTAMIAVVWFGCLIFIILIWKRFPQKTDVLYIRNELKIYLLVNILNFISALGVQIVLKFFFPEIGYIISYMAVLINLVMFYVLIIYPINNMDISDETDYEELSVSNRDILKKQPNPSTAMKSWIHFLNDKEENYAVFMQHVGREFTSETLLFITEYVQFKRYIIDNVQTIDISEVIGKCDQLRLPETNEFPTSFIVDQYKMKRQQTDFDEKICFIEAMEALFVKYIESGKAFYEINISYEKRQKITKCVRGVNWKGMSDVDRMSEMVENTDNDLNVMVVKTMNGFEVAADAMARLLVEPFQRFKCV